MNEKILNKGFWLYTIFALFKEVVEVCFVNESLASLLSYAVFVLAVVLLLFLYPKKMY